MQKTKVYNLRPANIHDSLNIVIIAKEAYLDAMDTETYSFSPQKVLTLAQNSIENDDFLVMVLEDGKEIVGYFFGMVSECFFGKEKQAISLSWFISREHRSLKNALSMLKAYEKWAIEKEVATINMVDIKLNANKIFERLGFKLTENTYVKRNR